MGQEKQEMNYETLILDEPTPPHLIESALHAEIQNAPIEAIWLSPTNAQNLAAAFSLPPSYIPTHFQSIPIFITPEPAFHN